MKLTMLPLENDQVIRVRSEGKISRRQTEDPLSDLLGPDCYTHRVLLSLDRAPGIDTSGVCWLVGSHKLFQDAGGKLVLVGVPPVVTDVFDFLRLTPLLHIAADEKEAGDLVSDTAQSPLVEEHPIGPANCFSR